MDLELSTDQVSLADALERLTRDWVDPGALPAEAFLHSASLEAALAEHGFLHVASEGFGAMGAVLLIEAVARTPFAVEIATSALIAPLLGLAGLGRPLAVVGPRDRGAVRFLDPAGAALVDDGEVLRLLSPQGRVSPVSGYLAYPYGRFEGDAFAEAEPLPDIDLGNFRTLRRIGLAAEMLGAMDRALDMTVNYVKERVQFGRPIGAFQAVGHRLAECAALVHGVRYLLYRAAASGAAGDAAAALAIAQDATARLIWETNQLHGAIALTLEYPLHHWNFRLRALQGEMGGATAAAAVAARNFWPDVAASAGDIGRNDG